MPSCFFHVYGKGTDKGEGGNLLNASGFTDPDFVSAEFQDLFPHGKDIQSPNNKGTQKPFTPET